MTHALIDLEAHRAARVPQVVLERGHLVRRLPLVAFGEVAEHGRAAATVVDFAGGAVVEGYRRDIRVLRGQVEREPDAHREAHDAHLAATAGCARRRAMPSAARRVAASSSSCSTSAFASGTVAAVRPSYRSGASATKPASASRSQCRRIPSLSPHHAWSTSTPGPPAGRAGDVGGLSLH